MSLRPRARHTAGHPTSTPHNHNTACADLGSGIYSMHFFKNSATLFNATAILAPSRHHAITSHTVRQTQHTHDCHAGGPEALLRVLCRYLTRVSDRTSRRNDTLTDQRLGNDHRAVLSERLHRAFARGRGWVFMRMGSYGDGGRGGVHKRAPVPDPPLRADPNSRAPAGPGPSPLVSLVFSLRATLFGHPPAPIVSLHRVDALLQLYKCVTQ